MDCSDFSTDYEQENKDGDTKIRRKLLTKYAEERKHDKTLTQSKNLQSMLSRERL